MYGAIVAGCGVTPLNLMALVCALNIMDEDYKNCRIVNIWRNKRTGNIHACLESEKGELLISATLEYILKALNERIPTEN